MHTSTLNMIFILTVILLIISTTLGSIWFYHLEEDKKNQKGGFELTEEYEYLSIVLLIVPLSLFCLVIVILIRLICFFDTKKKSGYGVQEDEEDVQTQEIIKFYFDMMEKVVF